MWDPAQYSRFRDERKRPFFDLLARVDVESPTQVADLGCGTGDLTRLLARRWPSAQVYGVDASSEMVEAARRGPALASPRFEVADLADWRAPALLDVLVSNAALHWLPDHEALLGRLVAKLAPGGVLAFQVPANFEAPSHRRVDEVRALPRFASVLKPVRRRPVEALPVYASWLFGLGLTVEAWETTYLHVLPGEDAVLAWLLGTTLRPVLAALGPEASRDFVETLRPLLRESYPAQPYGTPFPFTRRFVVARRVT
ncbi:methyltransferase domain-containing protein [Corallococcus macrosporus]|uniref:Trans-aconitate 2-methyltransferase n=2 Tax=Myxococcaceae TaxID=31 RepID=A0A250K5T6_9BACT|nr:methyltransferase domain-containing protein [Corallococcus macrosporus]AEI64539.1 trans-aconitate methyltransferase [Corallococcus macrosporus]ATB50696.1 trans-aconitate 2-methyltransferase [Corallococcus macrosporus DSM 14697]